jgi:hypothetical protein
MEFSIVRYIKDKITKNGNIVSKWICQQDPAKDYSDFELLEKSVGAMIEEDWVLIKESKDEENGIVITRRLSVEKFINGIWEERMGNEK